MFKSSLVLVGLLFAIHANAGAVTFDRSGTDPAGVNLAGTTILDLTLPTNTFLFNFVGSLDLNGRLNNSQNSTEFGLYLDNSLIKNVSAFSVNADDDIYSFNFTGLAAGNYSLRFNISGNNTARQYTLLSTITPVPEANTNAMLALGLGMVGLMMGRRKQA